MKSIGHAAEQARTEVPAEVIESRRRAVFNLPPLSPGEILCVGHPPCPYLVGDGDGKAHCELAEVGIRVFERRAAEEERRAEDWRHAFNMYRTAWLRELGGKLIPKRHEIDAFVLTTRALRERAERGARLKQLVEDKGFFAVLEELTGLAGGVGGGLLRFYIKSAADVAKNMEHAEAVKAGEGSTG